MNFLRSVIVLILAIFSFTACGKAPKTALLVPDTTPITEAVSETETPEKEKEEVTSVPDTASSSPIVTEEKGAEKTENDPSYEPKKMPVETPVPHAKSETQSVIVPETTPETIPKTESVTETEAPVPTPTEAPFDIDYWIAYAKDYAVSVGLILNPEATACWDYPIAAGTKCTGTERDIRDCLSLYARDEDIMDVWIWYEKDGNNRLDIYIGYA